ncbi:MAG: hypothetical protein GF398_03480 [Chitinivibrionales bacterium]|nr:hypothetical protein [Chitinivibrionales bacterium]
MRNIIISLAALFAILLTLGCSSFSVGPAQTVGKKPELPSVASMEIPPLGESDALAKAAAAKTNIAYLTATTAVSYWTLTIELALLEPVALFALAHTVDPEPLPDNSGSVWTIGDNGFQAQLTGKVAADSVRWSMSVTGGDLVNFVWFEGTSTITGNAGYWVFHDTTLASGIYPELIKFTYETSDAREEVKVEVVKQNDIEYGSYLQWTALGAEMFFESFDATQPETVLISWNEAVESGYIENVTSGEKYCWDTKSNGHKDIPCAL